MSNWENRPLRESQKHYAALDAFVLTKVVSALIKATGSKEELQVDKFVHLYDLAALASAQHEKHLEQQKKQREEEAKKVKVAEHKTVTFKSSCEEPDS